VKGLGGSPYRGTIKDSRKGAKGRKKGLYGPARGDDSRRNSLRKIKKKEGGQERNL